MNFFDKSQLSDVTLFLAFQYTDFEKKRLLQYLSVLFKIHKQVTNVITSKYELSVDVLREQLSYQRRERSTSQSIDESFDNVSVIESENSYIYSLF